MLGPLATVVVVVWIFGIVVVVVDVDVDVGDTPGQLPRERTPFRLRQLLETKSQQ